jgi:hypothetical protein
MKNKTKEYTVTDIIWDFDGGEKVKLPKTLTIVVPDDIDEDISEYISDKISDITGFCHKGFSTTPEIKW